MTEFRPAPLAHLRRALALTALALAPAVAAAPAHDDARQVTLFGVLATPGETALDPRLESVQEQLRKLLPGHGFRFLGVQSRRLVAGQSMSCDLRDGFSAEAVLVDPLDANGKVQLRCSVSLRREFQFGTVVDTPPNQLFFFEKRLSGGQRMLVGVGAR